MIRNPRTLSDFEAGLARREGRVDYHAALEQVAALWREGVALGVLPPSDPMEGIDTDIRLARILNSCSRTSS